MNLDRPSILAEKIIVTEERILAACNAYTQKIWKTDLEGLTEGNAIVLKPAIAAALEAADKVAAAEAYGRGEAPSLDRPREAVLGTKVVDLSDLRRLPFPKPGAGEFRPLRADEVNVVSGPHQGWPFRGGEFGVQVTAEELEERLGTSPGFYPQARAASSAPIEASPDKIRDALDALREAGRTFVDSETPDLLAFLMALHTANAIAATTPETSQPKPDLARAVEAGVRAGLASAIRGVDASALNHGGDCDRRGSIDGETGEVPCEGEEDRGCACSVVLEFAGDAIKNLRGAFVDKIVAQALAELGETPKPSELEAALRKAVLVTTFEKPGEAQLLNIGFETRADCDDAARALMPVLGAAPVQGVGR